jgi:hypothetical protein
MEKNGSGKPLNKPGLYRHKETGAEVTLNDNPGIGTPMIDAFIQAGFVKVEEPIVAPEIEKAKK